MEEDRSIILRRKVRPGGTTFAANERRPINGRRSRFVVIDFESQDEVASLLCALLSGGDVVQLRLGGGGMGFTG